MGPGQPKCLLTSTETNGPVGALKPHKQSQVTPGLRHNAQAPPREPLPPALPAPAGAAPHTEPGIVEPSLVAEVVLGMTLKYSHSVPHHIGSPAPSELLSLLTMICWKQGGSSHQRRLYLDLFHRLGYLVREGQS